MSQEYILACSFKIIFVKKELARQLVEKTLSDYGLISEHFSKTRSFFWHDLAFIKNLVIPGERILDLGCGNGRLLELLKEKDINYLGVDNSEKLIDIARKKYPQKRFMVADALDLPLPDNYFDKVISIAVFHHIPSKELRFEFLRQVKKVLKPEGKLILTVWSLNRKRFFKYHLKYLFLKVIGKSELDFKDILYPWKSSRGKTIVKRYLHCFTKRELENLIEKLGFQVKEISFSDDKKRNIYVIAKRL